MSCIRYRSILVQRFKKFGVVPTDFKKRDWIQMDWPKIRIQIYKNQEKKESKGKDKI